MSNFEEKKDEYIERLMTRISIVESLIKNSNSKAKDNENFKKMNRIVLNPKDELELRIANSILDVIESLEVFSKIAMTDVIKPIPKEENIGISHLISTLEKTKNNVNGDTSSSSDIDLHKEPEEQAKIFYQLLNAFLCDTEETIQYITEKLDLDPTTLDGVAMLDTLFDNISNLYKNNDNKKSLDEVNENDVEEFERFATTFKNLVDKDVVTMVLDVALQFFKKKD